MLDSKEILKTCKNPNNLGNSCWEFCAYRENGCCELSKTEIIIDRIYELFGVKLNYSDLCMQLLELETPNKRKAIVSGSFDPFTFGHLDIVKQASKIFDEVYVVIFDNAKKKRTFPTDLMVKAIKETLENEGITNVCVDCSHSLLAKYCAEKGIEYTVRGLRNNMDYNYEENIAEVNKLINPNLTTVYLKAQHVAISSSMVKELINYGEDVSKYLPKPILNYLFPFK